MKKIAEYLGRLERGLEWLRDVVVELRELVEALPGFAKAVGWGGMGASGIACIATGGFGFDAADGRPVVFVTAGISLTLPLLAVLSEFPRRLLHQETARERSRRQLSERTPDDLVDQLDAEARTRRVLSDSLRRQPWPPLEQRPFVGEVLRDLDELLRRNGHEKPVALLAAYRADRRVFEVVVDRGPADDGLKEGSVWDAEEVRDSGGRPFEKVLQSYCYAYQAVPFYGHDDEYCLLVLSARPFCGNEALCISHAATHMLVQLVVEENGTAKSEEASDS